MSTPESRPTEVTPDGLRYRSKAAGSPFSGQGTFAIATMSCLLCGRHRPRSQLKPRKMLNRTHYVCAPSCD